jgi:hypothetical protein
VDWKEKMRRKIEDAARGNVEVVLDVCPELKNSRCKLCSKNNRRPWLGKGKDSKMSASK